MWELAWKGGIDWIHLAQGTDKWRDLVNTVMNHLGIPQNASSSLPAEKLLSSSSTSLHGVPESQLACYGPPTHVRNILFSTLVSDTLSLWKLTAFWVVMPCSLSHTSISKESAVPCSAQLRVRLVPGHGQQSALLSSWEPYIVVRFGVPTAVLMKIPLFSDTTCAQVYSYQGLQGACCHHHQRFIPEDKYRVSQMPFPQSTHMLVVWGRRGPEDEQTCIIKKKASLLK